MKDSCIFCVCYPVCNRSAENIKRNREGILNNPESLKGLYESWAADCDNFTDDTELKKKKATRPILHAWLGEIKSSSMPGDVIVVNMNGNCGEVQVFNGLQTVLPIPNEEDRILLKRLPNPPPG